MKIVIAMDSLKGSLSSYEAGKAIRDGIQEVDATAQVVIKPLADGGEGTVDALVEGMKGRRKSVCVHGPLMQPAVCTYGYLQDSNTAIIEMAEAAGLNLVAPEQRNPLYTTTYGVGEMIAHAVHEGIRNFIIGIGGSATSDCGIGMLQALGYVFRDSQGCPVGFGGIEAERIASVDDSGILPELRQCTFHIACDVTNPLYGPQGAPAVYGPQKGATPEIVSRLDAGCRSFAAVTARYAGRDVSQAAGAGAAGGLGFAFLAYLQGQLESGIEIILQEINLAEEARDADYVITGEGRLDYQTAMGKAPIGVAKLAKAHGAKVIALAGSTADGARQCNAEGIDAFFPIINQAMPLQEAMDAKTAYSNMRNTAEQVFRLVKAVSH